MVRNQVITALLTGVTAFGLVACGSDQAGEGTGGETGDQPRETVDHTQDADAANPGEAVGLDEADRYVTITACTGAPDQTVGVSATVEVVNPLDEPMEYYGTVEFRDASGTVLTDGSFNTGTLEPGATSTEEVPGANVYAAVPGVTCELSDLKADAPA